MPSFRLVLPLAALLLAGAAQAQPEMPKCRPAGWQPMTSEQRLMMFADAKKATADGSLDERDYRAMQRDKMRAMSEEQRQAYFADLTKRWNALPAAEQKKLKEEAEASRKTRMAQGGAMGGPGMGGPGMAGPGMGGPGAMAHLPPCPPEKK